MLYSVIIPVYNRPDEIFSLLQCLDNQTFKNFDVCIVESGSEFKKSDIIVSQFQTKLDISYLPTGNNGPGISRNFGMNRAKGDFFIILDSDVLLEPNFIENVDLGINTHSLDCYGGPDRCHHSFLDIEKAINYSLTSFLSTGGMRGSKTSATTFHPRSFNMGFSRKVFEATGGFLFGFMGEDIVLSLKIKELGFKIGFISDAFVYHHRKKDFTSFYKQMNFFGKARINITKHIQGSLKFIHFVPVFFMIYFVLTYLMLAVNPTVFISMKALFYTYFALIFIDSSKKNHSLQIGFLSMIAVFVQFFGYGIGFLDAYWNRMVLKDKTIIKNI